MCVNDGNSIDTPGVIQRVSVLFRGHPELIGGFNTFLPPGYRIDISSDPRDGVIIVTTPDGVINQPTDGSLGRLIPNSNLVQQSTNFSNGNAANANLQNLVMNASSLRPITPHDTPSIPFARVQQPQPVPGFHDMPPPGSYSPAGLRVGAQTPNDAAVSILGNLSGRNPPENNRASGGGQTGEFNHAIQYLNKIKMRYSDDQNTYKSFLEILQTYQKEQRHLHDVRTLNTPT